MDKNLIINKYEIALFPKDFATSDFNSLLEEIKENVTVFADGINTVIPVPADAPREIPRILLRSKDSTIGCNLSLDKVNISWTNQKKLENFKKPVNEIQVIVEKLSNVLLGHTPTKKIKRIGYIKEFFYESENPVGLISEKTVNNKIAENLRNFLLRFTYGLKLKKWENCNEVIIMGNGKRSQTEEKKILILSDDINTSQDDDVKWETEDIKKFIEEADKKIKTDDLIQRFFKQDAS